MRARFLQSLKAYQSVCKLTGNYTFGDSSASILAGPVLRSHLPSLEGKSPWSPKSKGRGDWSYAGPARTSWTSPDKCLVGLSRWGINYRYRYMLPPLPSNSRS